MKHFINFILPVSILFLPVSLYAKAPLGEGILKDALSTVLALGYGPCEPIADLGPSAVAGTTIPIVTNRSYECADAVQLTGSLATQKSGLTFVNSVGLWVSPESKMAIPRENAAKLLMVLLKSAKHNLGVTCQESELTDKNSVKLICPLEIKNDQVSAWSFVYSALDQFPANKKDRANAQDVSFSMNPLSKVSYELELRRISKR